MKTDAFGFIEARGLVAAILAADAMIKSANVKLIRQHQLDPRLITLVVTGDLAACRAAVDAGVAAASRVGEVVSRLEIGRPDDDTGRMVLDLIDHSKDNVQPPATPQKKAPDPDHSTAATPPSPLADLPDPQTIEGIVKFIADTAKGRTWTEIIKHFPEWDNRKNALEDLLKTHQIIKSGNRYIVQT